ncbi:hypothetical protein L6164_016723 [Bauhinia variegata]|uniref:Uncharacterized protein n=1 Tax=Bauhinia variegata TaxID=167791 RepID=A0ACB9N6W1_BAUVA|nr:hypothetical protein L6164_016723 [Bauhinia variegata]
MIDSPHRDALELNMYIARQHSQWNNPQPALLPPPVVSPTPQYTPLPLSPAPWHDGWYFFTPRYRKYPNGKRPNRSTNNGYWKATAADKEVCHGDQIIGYKRTLVFYHEKPPKGTKTDWIMHEYTLKEPIRTRTSSNDMKLDEWVLCKIYERRKRLEDAKDNDQTQLSTLSQYLLHPLHQLLPQVPSEVSQKPQQTPLPPSQPPQLVTSLHMDAHKVNTYSFGQLFPWNNPQPILLSPLPLSQPQHTQMVDLPPQDA